MSLSIFSQRKLRRKIQELELDATLSENHSYTNDITDYPVEDGYNVTDNVKQRPVKLTIEGLTTNSPIVETGDNITRDDGSDRAQNAFNYILGLAGYEPPKQSGIPSQKVKGPEEIDVVTALKTYTNMFIENVNFPVNPRTGQAAYYTVELKQVRKVRPKNVFVPKVSTANGKAANIENQAPKEVDGGKLTTESVNNESTLYSITTAKMERIERGVQ